MERTQTDAQADASLDLATQAARPRSLPPTGVRSHGATTPRSLSPGPSVHSGGGSSGAELAGEALRRGASETVLEEALASEEAARARGFATIIATTTLVVGLTLPLLGGEAIARWSCTAALAVMCVASLVVRTIAKDPARYTMWVYRVYAGVLASSVMAVEYYIGYFSPVPVALTLGIYFIAQSRDRLWATLVPALVVAFYALLSTLTALGVLRDRSLFPASEVGLDSKLFVVVWVSLVLLLTQNMARVSLRSLQDALRMSHRALRMAAERAAQLEEARQNLDRALKAAVGKAGRYTGAMAGDYELKLVIGVGAMGEVYAARHRDTGARAAVKLLQADAVERDDLVERFLREGQICSGLTSPHVVRVREVGRMADGAPFMTMDFLVGEDLAARLRRDGHLSLKDATVLASQVVEGLGCAHAAGIIHRDLKPHNLFRSRSETGEPVWKILDFGISKLSNTDGTLTEHTVVGTPGYMAPEQARSEGVDRRSDLFSMGVVLYRTLTGRPPFGGANSPEILFEIVFKTPERPSSLRASLPSDIDLVLAIALAKHPDHRFQSAQDLARAFRAAAKQALSAELRARGQAVVELYPWGRTLHDTLSGSVDEARG